MGWSYSDWNGVFYPANTDSRDALSLYARSFDAVEIDSTFYGTPREPVVKHWAKSTPTGFVFCSKVPRLITHDMGLRDALEPLQDFVRVMALLGPKRGPMLFQMPPSFTLDEADALKTLLPELEGLNDPAARFAIEFRHPSLLTKEVFALLADHNIALAATDYPGMPRRFVATTDFAYLRLIGKHGAFEQHRETQANHSAVIRRWAEVLQTHQSRFKTAYICCNNDYEGFAPATCDKMKQALGLPVRPSPEIQGSLF
jgi:uncharacterized protein YecE (DUF72 family)